MSSRQQFWSGHKLSRWLWPWYILNSFLSNDVQDRRIMLSSSIMGATVCIDITINSNDPFTQSPELRICVITNWLCNGKGHYVEMVTAKVALRNAMRGTIDMCCNDYEEGFHRASDQDRSSILIQLLETSQWVILPQI